MSKLLIKYASRERPQRLFKVIDLIFKNVENKDDVILLLSFDKDDVSIYNQETLNKIKVYLENYNIKVYFSERTTKSNAFNRDIEKVDGWDRILFITDFTEIRKKGFEQILLSKKDKISMFKSNNSNGLQYHFLYCFSKELIHSSAFMFEPIFNPNLSNNFLYEEIHLRFNKSFFSKEKESIHYYVHPKWGYYKTDSLLIENQKEWKNDLQYLEELKHES